MILIHVHEAGALDEQAFRLVSDILEQLAARVLLEAPDEFEVEFATASKEVA